jgi:hypothetical protein
LADPSLAPGQYSIGHDGGANAIVYGLGASSIQIQNTAYDPGTLAVQDQSVVGADGMLFGVDTQPGAVITQTGIAYTSPALQASAMDAYSSLAAIWNDPTIRLNDNLVQVFRAFYRGSNVVRRAYGRGRKIAPTYGQVYTGQVPFVGQFQCADNNWYSDTASTAVATIRPSPFGYPMPIVLPQSVFGGGATYFTTCTNTGTLPTWPVFTITGPISNPLITYSNTPVSIGYTGVLKNTDQLVIDTRPWARTFLLNGANAAGAIIGSPMISMALLPGVTTLVFSGGDRTGVATLNVSWRSATAAIGGST